jgi:DNA polymerase-1
MYPRTAPSTLEGTLLRNSQGIPTNAVYIFVTMLRKLLKDHAPEFIAASFDLPGPTFRDDLALDYKANRKPMPDELAGQIPLVHRACEALACPSSRRGATRRTTSSERWR